MDKTVTKLTERDIQNALVDLGTPPNILGFTYLTKAIIMVHENPDWIHRTTKTLYPEVANATGSTPARVERAIRHAIEVTWSRGDRELFTTMFGRTIAAYKGKPTNSEFIAMIAMRLEQELDNRDL